ncbi:hypothetical protein VNO77_15340 [Canavalia gladiata]|uniref:Uncharacterized protein n=1 Tax=Canavalia gladiata TaxID=3824 RepID=A0AAN9QRB8_CANGL
MRKRKQNEGGKLEEKFCCWYEFSCMNYVHIWYLCIQFGRDSALAIRFPKALLVPSLVIEQVIEGFDMLRKKKETMSDPLEATPVGMKCDEEEMMIEK